MKFAYKSLIWATMMLLLYLNNKSTITKTGGLSMKAVITVIGCDKIGIIATVTGVLAKANVNILDISQTIMQNIFSIIMLVDISKMNCEFSELSDQLKQTAQELGVDIRFQREEIFTSMHRI